MSEGKPVFLHYSQAALDAAYDQAVWAPNLDDVMRRFALASDATRRRLGQPRRLSYGTSACEQLDFFPARKGEGPRPLNIFVHGGAWHARTTRNYAYLAEVFVGAGAHFAALEFVSVDDNGGDLLPMAAQVRAGIAWLAAHAEELGIDPDRIHISAHSSGSHLAAVALSQAWEEFDLPKDLIKSAVLASGMYDMQAVRLSARSSYVRFTDEMEDAMSPQRHLQGIHTPLVLATGSAESPEFIRQSKDFAAALERAGKPVQLLHGEGYNHFDMLETLANPYALLGAVALEKMGLA
jgi:arylformamidase